MPENKNIPEEYVEKLDLAELKNELTKFCQSKGVELTAMQLDFALHVLSFKEKRMFERASGKTFLFGILNDFINHSK